MRGLFGFIARSRLARCQRGATAVEYGFIIALIVLAIMVSLNEVAKKTINMWGNVATKVNEN
jgi:pilus assembly protein Flp/PilA